MPDDPQPQPVSITEFLGRTTLDLPSTDDFHAFALEIRSIGDALNSLNTNLKDAIEAQQKLAEIYETGISKQASTASAPEGTSAPPTGASGNASTSTAAPTPAASPAAEQAGRQALADQSGYDKLLARASAWAPGSPYNTTSGPATATDQLAQSMPTAPWHQLNYGEWKAQDFLERGGALFGTVAQAGQSKYQNQLDAAQQQALDANPNLGDDQALVQAQQQVGGPPQRAMRAANTLFTASQYMPLTDMAQTLAGKAGYNISPTAMAQQGEQAGQPSGSGAIDIGPVRIPTGSGLAGFRQNWEQLKDAALSPGYTKEQADTVYNEVQGLGFRGQSGFPGQRFGDLRTAGKHIMQYSKEVGNNPEAYQLMDKASRWGTEGLNSFVRSMKEVPDAATKAGVSVSQLLTDMNQAGELNQSVGGTHAQGQQYALDLANQGLPPGPFVEATNNPLVQGQAFRQSGLLPWQQGLLSSSDRMGAIMSSVNQTYQAVGKYPDRTSPLPGLAGKLGARSDVTGQDQAIAQVHQMYPELSPEILKHMVNPNDRKAIEAGMAGTDAIRSWGGGVRADLPGFKTGGSFKMAGQTYQKITGTKGGDLKGLEASFDPRSKDGGAFTWGDQVKLLDQAKTLDPNTGQLQSVMNKGDWKKVALAGVPKDLQDMYKESGTDYSASKWRDLALHGGPDIKKMEKGGISPKERNQIQRAASSRQKTIEDILRDKNKTDTGGPKVTIELGPAAKKVLHVQTSRQEAASAARQGGSSAVVNMGQPSQGFSPFNTGDPSGLPVTPGDSFSNPGGTP